MGLTRLPNATVGGQVLLDGVDLLALPSDGSATIRGRRVAMIFQDPLSSLHPLYRVGLADRRGDPRARAGLQAGGAGAARSRRSRAVGIPNPAERVDRYPHELSGGMRQRAMIAMALVLGPDVLIADEPTTALDVTVQAQILELIAELQREFGTAVVLITHDLGVIAETADEVAVMYAGRIVEQGAARDDPRRARAPVHVGPARSRFPRLDGPRRVALRPIEGTPPSLDPPAERLPVPSALPVRDADVPDDRPRAARVRSGPPRRLPPAGRREAAHLARAAAEPAEAAAHGRRSSSSGTS